MIDTIYPLTVTRADLNIIHCKVQGIFPRNIEKYEYMRSLVFFLDLLGGRAPCSEHQDEHLVHIPEGDLRPQPGVRVTVTENRNPARLFLGPGVNIWLLG